MVKAAPFEVESLSPAEDPFKELVPVAVRQGVEQYNVRKGNLPTHLRSLYPMLSSWEPSITPCMRHCSKGCVADSPRSNVQRSALGDFSRSWRKRMQF